MENRVGDKTPPEQVLAKLLTQLEDVRSQLRKFGVTLTPEERKRQLHARKGGDEHAGRTLALAQKHNLKIPGIPLDGMQNDLHLAKVMTPFIDVATAILQLVEDTAGQAESEYWQAFLAYYGTLGAMATKNPEIAAEYGPTVEFMSNGPRRKPTPAK